MSGGGHEVGGLNIGQHCGGHNVIDDAREATHRMRALLRIGVDEGGL